METKSLVYSGDGYTLNYDSKWRATTESETYEDALEYKNQRDYLVPIDVTTFSDIEEFKDLDISTKEGRNKIYSDFSEYWIEDSEDEDTIVKEESQFKLLKDDIYYATFEYENVENDMTGHYILMISKKSNVFITMATICSTEDLDDFMEEVIKILKTIEIDER